MVPTRLFLAAVLLLAQTAPPEASQYCCSLEYWNPDNKCCSRCLWRFGPPCPDKEFVENCGHNDFGDIETHPFKNCSPGWCNPDREELCRPCGTGTPALTLARNCNRIQQRCKERPIGTDQCSTTRIVLNHLNQSGSYEPSLPATDSLSWPSNSIISPPNFVLPLVLVPLLLVTVSVILLALWRHCLPKGEATANTGSVHGRPNTFSLSWPLSTGTLVLSGVGSTGVAHSLQRHVSRELPNLASQPLSCLLEELEVLEELILLLDPEPGPGGSGACGTTRHLAARYGLPATWSTFAYSLRPSQSPLRALIEVVVAREPSASLGQFGSYLAQIGRADALQVLSRLTGPTLFNKNEALFEIYTCCPWLSVLAEVKPKLDKIHHLHPLPSRASEQPGPPSKKQLQLWDPAVPQLGDAEPWGSWNRAQGLLPVLDGFSPCCGCGG